MKFKVLSLNIVVKEGEVKQFERDFYKSHLVQNCVSTFESSTRDLTEDEKEFLKAYVSFPEGENIE